MLKQKTQNLTSNQQKNHFDLYYLHSSGQNDHIELKYQQCLCQVCEQFINQKGGSVHDQNSNINNNDNNNNNNNNKNNENNENKINNNSILVFKTKQNQKTKEDNDNEINVKQIKNSRKSIKIILNGNQNIQNPDSQRQIQQQSCIEKYKLTEQERQNIIQEIENKRKLKMEEMFKGQQQQHRDINKSSRQQQYSQIMKHDKQKLFQNNNIIEHIEKQQALEERQRAISDDAFQILNPTVKKQFSKIISSQPDEVYFKEMKGLLGNFQKQIKNYHQISRDSVMHSKQSQNFRIHSRKRIISQQNQQNYLSYLNL